jgi:hypothetical protein
LDRGTESSDWRKTSAVTTEIDRLVAIAREGALTAEENDERINSKKKFTL